MYPQTLVSSFPGLIIVARVKEREQLMSQQLRTTGAQSTRCYI